MGPAALVAAWCLSLAPLLLERAGKLDLSAVGSEAAPRLGLCALVWIALASMPRRRVGGFDLRTWWGTSVASLPVLAAATALDLSSGADAQSAALAAIWALCFVAICALAADLARRSLRSQRAHAALWLAIFLGAPLYCAAVSWGARSGGTAPPAWASLAAKLSPLEWSFRAIESAAPPYAALAAALALCALASATSSGARS